MTLSDVMGHSGLAGYAIVAMILFALAFVAVVLWIFAPGRKRDLQEASRLPLDDEPEATPGTGAKR